MRRWTLLLGVLLAGCTASTYGVVGTGEPDGEGGNWADGDPDADSFVLDLDTSATNPFIEGFPATAMLRGTATASEGLARVEVSGAVTQTDGGGNFEVEVPVAPGLVVIPVAAFDAEGHTRQGDRTLIDARFLPEGETNGGAAAITVTNEILAALAGDQLDQVADMDLSDEIMAQAGAIDAQGCEIDLQNVRHGSPNIALTVEAGQLMVLFTIPSLYVTFTGQCDMLIMSTSFSGNLSSDIVVRTALTAPPSDECLETYVHSYPTVELPNFDLSLQSNEGGMIGMLMPLVGEIMQGGFADTMAEQIATEADGIIAEQVAQFGQLGLGTGTTMTFNGVDMEVGFCLTGLESVEGQLRARLGMSVLGPGGASAPGAPMVDGDLGAAAPSTLWLDANLISQMMYSLWAAGGLSGESTGDIATDLLGLLVPEISDAYPEPQPLTIGIEGQLPPLVRAAEPEAGGDLLVDIGDLIIDLSVDGELLFRMSAIVHLTLDLQSQDGAIMPVIVTSSAEVSVLEEPLVDADDASLEAAVQMSIGGQAQALLGDAGIALPAFGGLSLVPQDAVPEPGGRYVRVTLAP